MQGKTPNAQFRIPGQQGVFGVYQSSDSDQLSARLQSQQVFYTDAPSEWIANNGITQSSEHPTFAQVEPFLYSVGDWLAFDRKEVNDNR